MWCAGDASDVDRERSEGALAGVREGWPIGSFACLKRSHGHVPGCMGAARVQGERTHHARPAGAKKTILIRRFRPWELTGDFYAPSIGILALARDTVSIQL